jgi:hypothetical protein
VPGGLMRVFRTGIEVSMPPLLHAVWKTSRSAAPFLSGYLTYGHPGPRCATDNALAMNGEQHYIQVPHVPGSGTPAPQCGWRRSSQTSDASTARPRVTW